MEKTTGECLRNNWNSINDAKQDEKRLRINIQNNFSGSGIFDKKFYIENLWNEKVEDITHKSQNTN